MSLSPKTRQSNSCGSGHWILQRLSALILIVLLFWLAIFLVQIHNSDREQLVSLFFAPTNFLFLSSLVLVGLYHGALGIQVILEDYIANLVLRSRAIRLLFIFTATAAFSFLIAALKGYLIN